jgi:hypothetical protein
MPSGEEISHSLRGAVLLARFDARGVGHFNITLDGFWRSFVGALLVLPLTVLTMLAESGGTEIAWSTEAVRYAGGWMLFPIVMIPIARLLGLSQHYVGFVIAYNWTQVVQSILFFVLGVLHRTQIPFLAPGGVLDYAVLVYCIVYFVFVARVTLGVGPLTGSGLAILDMVTSYLVLVALPQLL